MSECHRTESLERHNDDLNDNQTAMIYTWVIDMCLVVTIS